jgi:hypothetical protein
MVSGSTHPSTTNADAPRNWLPPSRTMAAADALFVFFDIAASTLIFIKPAGGGIHCVVFGTFTLFAICYMERFLCEHEFVPILWNDIHHAAHNESSACGGFGIFLYKNIRVISDFTKLYYCRHVVWRLAPNTIPHGVWE